MLMLRQQMLLRPHVHFNCPEVDYTQNEDEASYALQPIFK
jgi:hypothetical protein